MKPTAARRLRRMEHRATAAGLTLAGAGLLALALCALGWRSAGQMPLDWALFALALAPASRAAGALIAPLFWLPGRAGA